VDDWFERLPEILRAGETAVLVTVVASKGSAPREAGTKMLVWRDGFAGTIGGGNLEYGAIGGAREALAEEGEAAPWWLQDLPLGPSLGQCCGGHVTLLYEMIEPAALAWAVPLGERLANGERLVMMTRLAAGEMEKSLFADEAPPDLPADIAVALQELRRNGGLPSLLQDGDVRTLLEPLHRQTQPLYLFGAGHVGRAIVRAFADLPFAITWIDSRPDMFPADGPSALRHSLEGEPTQLVGGAPPGTFFLVMTHSHDLDFEICEQVLRRRDFGFLGLIGSDSKKARCLKRLEARGFSPAELERLTCPIGIGGIASKVPAAIAVGVAAQLLLQSERIAAENREKLPTSNLEMTRAS